MKTLKKPRLNDQVRRIVATLCAILGRKKKKSVRQTEDPPSHGRVKKDGSHLGEIYFYKKHISFNSIITFN